MNSVFAKRRARLLAMKAMRDNYIPGEKRISCPQCGQETLVYQEGCLICKNCGASLCG